MNKIEKGKQKYTAGAFRIKRKINKKAATPRHHRIIL